MQPLADCTSLLALRRRGLQAHALASDVENYRRRRNQARALTEAEVRRRPVCCSAAAFGLRHCHPPRHAATTVRATWAKRRLVCLFGQALVGSNRGLLVPRFLSPLKEHSVSVALSEPFSTISLRPSTLGCRCLTATHCFHRLIPPLCMTQWTAPSVHRRKPVSAFVQSRKVALSNMRLRSAYLYIDLSGPLECAAAFVPHIFLAGTRLCLNSA